MKKEYTAPQIDVVRFAAENVIALSLVAGGKANGSDALSNSRLLDDGWDDED